jgi:hypothetical protein
VIIPADWKERSDESARAELATPTPPAASFGRKGARKKKKSLKAPGGRRNLLIRLDQAKEIKGFSLL